MEIALLGDVMLGRLVGDAILEYGPQYPWGDTLGILKKADLRIANLECPISDAGSPALNKRPVFRASPSAIGSLLEAGIDAVSLANNHVLDYGESALRDTIRMLDAAGIRHAGAGANARKAISPAVVEAKGIRVGMAAFTDNMGTWSASEANSGINHVHLFPIPPHLAHTRVGRRIFDYVEPIYHIRTRLRMPKAIEMAKKSISLAKGMSDIVIASAHMGPNWEERPNRAYVEFARAVVDCGADIYHGHSSHIFQGIELRKRKPVLFDTGDFVEDYGRPMGYPNDWSFIFLLDMDEESRLMKKLTLVPIFISRFQANIAPRFLAKRICERMAGLCAEMGTRARMDEGNVIITP